MTIQKIHEPGWQEIQKYLRMKFGEVEVACPYYMHGPWKPFTGVRVLSGKGFAEEIVEEANIFAKQEGVNIETLGPEQVRAFLIRHRLGVDCSGLIAHVLYAIHGKRFMSSFKTGFLRKMIMKIRLFEGIDVALLKASSTRVLLRDIKPEDLIITRGGDHALLVYEVEKGEQGDVKRIAYVHSTRFFRENGVRVGTIFMKDVQLPLQQQRWVEGEGEGEENYTYQGYLKDCEENGIFRLKY